MTVTYYDRVWFWDIVEETLTVTLKVVSSISSFYTDTEIPIADFFIGLRIFSGFLLQK